jgi:hypothetical protein
MTLWLRRSGLVSPADADRPDYLVIEHDKVIGRIYEQRYVPPDVRWFWSITALHIDPALGMLQTAACRRWMKLRRSLSRVGIECVRRVTKENSSSSKPTVREWRVTLMLNFGASKFLFCK